MTNDFCLCFFSFRILRLGFSSVRSGKSGRHFNFGLVDVLHDRITHLAAKTAENRETLKTLDLFWFASWANKWLKHLVEMALSIMLRSQSRAKGNPNAYIIVKSNNLLRCVYQKPKLHNNQTDIQMHWLLFHFSVSFVVQCEPFQYSSIDSSQQKRRQIIRKQTRYTTVGCKRMSHRTSRNCMYTSNHRCLTES